MGSHACKELNTLSTVNGYSFNRKSLMTTVHLCVCPSIRIVTLEVLSGIPVPFFSERVLNSMLHDQQGVNGVTFYLNHTPVCWNGH